MARCDGRVVDRKPAVFVSRIFKSSPLSSHLCPIFLVLDQTLAFNLPSPGSWLPPARLSQAVTVWFASQLRSIIFRTGFWLWLPAIPLTINPSSLRRRICLLLIIIIASPKTPGVSIPSSYRTFNKHLAQSQQIETYLIHDQSRSPGITGRLHRDLVVRTTALLNAITVAFTSRLFAFTVDSYSSSEVTARTLVKPIRRCLRRI